MRRLFQVEVTTTVSLATGGLFIIYTPCQPAITAKSGLGDAPLGVTLIPGGAHAYVINHCSLPLIDTAIDESPRIVVGDHTAMCADQSGR
jgi:hypothetical protein